MLQPPLLSSKFFRIMHLFLTALVLGGVAVSVVSVQTYSYPYVTPDSCTGIVNGFQQFFNITSVMCSSCTQNATIQTISSDGTHCVCQPGYYLEIDSGSNVTCGKCAAGETTSFDGWGCVFCNETESGSTTSCATCTSSSNDVITVQRQLDGSYSTNEATQTCESCYNDTAPDAAGRQCVRCNQALTVNGGSGCYCPNPASGLCFADPVSQVSVSVTFGTSTPIVSQYFTDYAQGAVGMCRAPNFNQTACELLGNLCTLILYSITPTSGPLNTVCYYYQQMTQNTNWPLWMPWLYYYNTPTETKQVLTDTGIPTAFTFPNTQINFRVGLYALNGSFLGYQPVTNGLLQLCKNTVDYLNAAYDFGTYYQQSCTMPVSSFWDERTYPPVFFDMWLEYTSTTGEQMLYAIPILITNYNSGNTGSDQSQWTLVRRFFLVDNISGKSASGTRAATNQAQGVRYAQSMSINIELQNGQSSGLIYPPYLTITYGYATPENITNNVTASLTFQVVYSMSYSSFQTGTTIAVIVLVVLAFVYSFVRTWSWSKRSRLVAINFLTLIKFLLYSCGYVANALFAVTLGASIYYLIFFKNQGTVVMVAPASSAEALYITLLAVGFALKFLDLVHVLYVQSDIDIFIIDWERPDSRRTPAVEEHIGGVPGKTSGVPKLKRKGQPVSIWRSYFVANEWNELQTTRQIEPVFQIITTVFFLEIVGFGNLATADPQKNYQLNNPNEYYAPTNSILRFALIGAVYLLTALAQWLYFTLIHERFIDDPIQSYVDFCSTTNTSILLLESDTYGYYIHGRTVHGRADTGLREMHENMEREKRDLCGQRGLVPGTEQQTFRMALPSKLKAKYERIIMPTRVLTQQGGAAMAGTRMRNAAPGSAGLEGGAAEVHTSIKLDPHTELCIEAYGQLNRLLQDFIDHALKDVDYEVKDRNLLEQILDIEFHEPLPEHGYFYKDNGHSFDNVLYYGNEIMLIVFEILFFGLVDLGTYNYFFDGAMLYLLMEVFVKRIRIALGRLNLAKKTLVDKRFLI